MPTTHTIVIAVLMCSAVFTAWSTATHNQHAAHRAMPLLLRLGLILGSLLMSDATLTCAVLALTSRELGTAVSARHTQSGLTMLCIAEGAQVEQQLMAAFAAWPAGAVRCGTAVGAQPCSVACVAGALVIEHCGFLWP